LKAKVTTDVKPTENPEKVLKAVTNLFPGQPTLQQGNVFLETSDLSQFQLLSQQRKIRDTLTSLLQQSHDGHQSTLLLDKEAAFTGKVNVYAESEMGPIRLELEVEKEKIRSIFYGDENE
jgi:predicted RNA binding protein with dsRBD fold (UPF0201 family)